MMEIKSGDKIYLHMNKSDNRYCYRTVRSVSGDNINIYHLGRVITVRVKEIIRVVKPIGSLVRGKTTLSELMYQKGVINEVLADKSGYSVGTVDRARRGLSVMPFTLSTLLDTINQM